MIYFYAQHLQSYSVLIEETILKLPSFWKSIKQSINNTDKT